MKKIRRKRFDGRSPRRWIDTRISQAHVVAMVAENPRTAPGKKLPVFSVTCWLLGMMGFMQLLVAGMALAHRFEDSRHVRVVEKEVLKSVIVRVPAAADPSVLSRPPVSAAPPVVSRPLVPQVMESPAASPTPLSIPRIADSRSERMVNEGREARIAGDMGKAIVKLEEALEKSPGDPNVHYELGLVHEQMGVFDTAASHYEKVFQMGVAEAGPLYALAAAKLRDGFAQLDAMLGKLALGRVRIFKNPNHPDGEQVILTIPVEKAPADEIEVTGIAVSVIFFNRTTQGEIVPLEDKSWVTERWISLPFDWAGGEESLRMTYRIPRQDEQNEQLFGGRSYHGQVVSLMYKGEVLDVQAWPRDLAAKIPKQLTAGPGELMSPEFQDALPPDFDPTVPLLPALPE